MFNEICITKDNVNITGEGKTAIIFAHGINCDQSACRKVTGSFEDDHKVVLFDFVGVLMDYDYLTRAQSISPAIVGADHPDSGEELAKIFCKTNPEILKRLYG